MCGEVCTDNRFELIEKAKEYILENTNISSRKDEMKVLDSFLFRCWQMGWLDRFDNPKSPWISVKDDLPCNHEELTHIDYTLEVLTLDNYNIYRVVRMWEFDGKWIWGLDDLPVTHWMRLPEPPKE